MVPAPHQADSWDAVGLVCGDPGADVRRILLAVDPVTSVADEAVEIGAQLVVTHHPLFLKGVHGVAATDPKGRIVHRLLTSGCGLFAAHTNADAPAGGVSESLALALGLADVRPLDPDPAPPLDKIVVFAPADSAEQLRAALTERGAGAIGDYDSCTFTSTGEGRFRPLDGADPTIGSVGRTRAGRRGAHRVGLPREHLRTEVVATVLAAHPYEEPAYDVLELAALDEPDRGSGRIGRLETPLSLARVRGSRGDASSPSRPTGCGWPGTPTSWSRPSDCAGEQATSSSTGLAQRAVDVYLTSDLRHHPASELREHGAPALVDVAHWAAEWTWLPVLRDRLVAALGDTVEVSVSEKNTDPWTFRV